MKSIKPVVTSALVITGATAAVSAIDAEAVELDHENQLQEEEDLIEMDILEKALRHYTNPLNRIEAEIHETDREDQFIYEVQAGDTLSEVSQKFDISVAEIVQENEIENKHQIWIGQELTIRLKEKRYSVRYGDTLEAIAKEKGISTEELRAHNTTLDKTGLYPGQQIHIPTIAPEILPEPVHQPLSTPKKNNKGNQIVLASRMEEISTTNLGSFAWPVKGKITSSFGMRWGRMHNGTDITHPDQANTPITAAREGIVTDAHHRGAYGNLVIIDHGSGVQTYYAHLSKIVVDEGQKVTLGEVVGYMGRTGNATGNHLHFEVRKDDRPLNPLYYLPK